MSCNAADIPIRRGNTTPLSWQFLTSENPDVPFPLAGSVMVLSVTFLTISVGAPSIVKSSAEGGLAIDYDSATVTWTPTAEESASIPMGALSSYQLNRQISETNTTLVAGSIIGI